MLAAALLAAATWRPAAPARATHAFDRTAFGHGADSVGVRLTFFDVGQGASTLLERYVLIDGGRNARLASEPLRGEVKEGRPTGRPSFTSRPLAATGPR